MARVVITGALGFVGQNLVRALKDRTNHELIELSRDSNLEDLHGTEVDHIIHLAGANRPPTAEGFQADNVGYAEQVLDCFVPGGPDAAFHYASTIRIDQDSPYGHSKKVGEDLVGRMAPAKGWKTSIWRLPNLFGKWCRPNYNSFVATFMTQAARGEKFSINDPASEVELLYVDDLVEMYLNVLSQVGAPGVTFVDRFSTEKTNVGRIAEMIDSFREQRDTANLPDIRCGFAKKLHATYLSYLEQPDRIFALTPLASETGSFCELFKFDTFGQVSVLTIEPGASRGNHFHNTKCENFHVVKGRVELTERDTRGGETLAVTIKTGGSFWTRPGWVHTLRNTGDSTVILVIWATEVYRPEVPDTYRLFNIDKAD